MSRNVSGEELEQLRQLEESLWRTETRFDTTHLESLLAPDFYEIGRSGRVYSRQQIVASETRHLDAILPLADFAARWLSVELAQVTYRSALRHPGGLENARRNSL